MRAVNLVIRQDRDSFAICHFVIYGAQGGSHTGGRHFPLTRHCKVYVAVDYGFLQRETGETIIQNT